MKNGDPLPPSPGLVRTTTNSDEVSKEQLEIRYKRCKGCIELIRQLLFKVSISVERLESENHSLREQNKYLNGDRCTGNQSVAKPNTKKSPSAAKAAIDLAVNVVERTQEKISVLEKLGLEERTTTEVIRADLKATKKTLEEVQLNLKQEQRKNGSLQERITFMENQFLKESTLRLSAERRFYSLQKEVRDLTDELSAQSSQLKVPDESLPQTSGSTSGTDTAPPMGDVETSTPHQRTTGRNFDKSSFKRAISNGPSRFDSVLACMGDKVHKFGGKLKKFIRTGKNSSLIRSNAFQIVQDALVEPTKIVLNWGFTKQESHVATN